MPDTTDQSNKARRLFSEKLWWLGFRYGTPIHWATADCTLEDLTRALFGGSDPVFTTVPEQFEIRMQVTGVRETLLCHDPSLAQELFPGSDEYWMVDGLLLTEHELLRGEHRLAIASTYEQGEPVKCRHAEEDKYPKVVAAVAFDVNGQFLDALVQKLPSPAEQLIEIPSR